MENVIYNDYASWLIENDEFFNKIKKNADFIYYRYEHIFDVIKYIYNKKVEKQELLKDEEDVFATGFNFLFEKTETIKSVMKSFFNDDAKNLKKEEKAINLFLDIQEFIKDLEVVLETDKFKALIDIEEEVYNAFKTKGKLPDDIYERFNVTSMNIYRENEIEFFPIKEIFYDIAEIYDLI